MPAQLYSINKDSLFGQTVRDISVHDVTETIDKERQDIVFLFSAYLYAINNIFDIEAVRTLVEYLRSRKYRIVTSDPFLGVQSEPNPATFSNRHPRKEWLAEHSSRLFELLKDVTQLYLVNAESFPNTRSVSFFNTNISVQPSALAERKRKLAERCHIDLSRKRWLCVLSSEDYKNQAGFHGRARFTDLRIKTLHETAREGSQPFLLAPQACLSWIRGRRPSIEGLALLQFCSYVQFMTLLHEAEYVFYWNIVSNSIPARVVNHLPVFFFDAGHMCHAIPPSVQTRNETLLPRLGTNLLATRPGTRRRPTRCSRFRARQRHGGCKSELLPLPES